MKKLVFIGLVLGMGTMSGCALLDSLSGVKQNKDGTYSRESDGGAIGNYAPLLDTVVPGAGALLGLFGMIYGNIRAKKYAKAGKSMMPAIDMVLDRLEKEKPLTREEVSNMLIDWKRRLDVEKEIKEMRGK